MEFLLVSDTHVDEYSKFSKVDPTTGMNSRLLWSLGIFDEILEYGKKHGITRLLVGGDVFDKRGTISVVVYDAVYEKFRQLDNAGWEVISIVGNHDQAARRGDVHALRPLPIHHLVESHGYVGLGGRVGEKISRLGCVSFCETPQEFLQRLKEVQHETSPQYYLIHQGVNGAHIAGDEILSRHETDLHDIRKIVGPDPWIFSGHYHIHQNLDPRFWYIGSSIPKDFGDKTPKGFLHFKDGKVIQIESRAPKFVVIESSEIPKRISEVQGNYVQIQYEGKEPDNLESLGAEGWVATKKKVEREYSRRSSIEPENSPMQILSSYLEDMKAAGCFPEGVSLQELQQELQSIIGERSLDQTLGGSRVNLTSLCMWNFMSHKHSEISFRDKEGLILIEGQNRDDPSATSNGSGKSLIPEAVKWTLYGSTSRGVTADGIIHRDSKEGAGAMVEFTLDSQSELVYTVRRYRKHPEYKNQIFFEVRKPTGVIIDLRGKSDAETQEKIIKVLGMDERTFDNTVFFGHGFTQSFPALTDKEQKAVLENILGVEYFAELHERTKEFGSATRNLFSQNEGKVAYLNQSISQEEKLSLEQMEKLTRFELERQSRIKQLEVKIQELNKELNQISGLGSVSSTLENVKLLRAELLDSEALMQDFQASKVALENSESARRGLEKKALQMSHRLEREQEALDRNSREIAKIEEAVKNRVCPTCTQKMGPGYDLSYSLQDLQKRRIELMDTVRNLKVDLVEVDQEAEKTAKESTQLSLEVKEKSDAFQEVKILDTEIRELQIKEEGVVALRASKAQSIQETMSAILEISTQDNPLASLVSRTEQVLLEKKTELQELLAESQALLKVFKIYAFWETAFSDKGTPSQSPIKSYLFDAVVPVLDELARMYSEILTSGSMEVRFNTVTALKSGEMRDKFSVEVENRFGSAGYLGDSGGERRKVDLIVMFALHALARIRSGSQFDCLFLDEILDSLDSEGCERVVYLLSEMRKEIPKILIITHNENLKSRFGSRILVRKENGVSRIVES